MLARVLLLAIDMTLAGEPLGLDPARDLVRKLRHTYPGTLWTSGSVDQHNRIAKWLKPGQRGRLLLGVFHGVPTTKKSVFDLPSGPDHIVLYQKNIEAVCSSEAEVREQIRLTVIHELGHYFGLDEEQLKDV
jgi:hypothetical protein